MNQRTIKFRYILLHLDSKKIEIDWLTIKDIEQGALWRRWNLAAYIVLHRNEFTGLLDKNRKEIYEGDIVKWRSHPDPMKRGEIKWGSCGFYIVWFDNELERERNFPRTKHLGGHLNTIEVIGNIYENPKLLK